MNRWWFQRRRAALIDFREPRCWNTQPGHLGCTVARHDRVLFADNSWVLICRNCWFIGEPLWSEEPAPSKHRWLHGWIVLLCNFKPSGDLSNSLTLWFLLRWLSEGSLGLRNLARIAVIRKFSHKSYLSLWLMWFEILGFNWFWCWKIQPL